MGRDLCLACVGKEEDVKIFPVARSESAIGLVKNESIIWNR